MTTMLKACLEMYKKDGFKDIVFDCGSMILKMQIQGLVKEATLTNVTI